MSPKSDEEERLRLRLLSIAFIVTSAMVVIVVAAAVLGQEHRVDATFLAVLVGAMLTAASLAVSTWKPPWSK